MMEQLLAHKWEEREQTIREHAEGTAELAECFAEAFGQGGQARMAGLLHDIGKCSEDFQRRIRDPEHTKRCNHSTAGAIEAKKRSQLMVAMCIMGHHSGLCDLGGGKGLGADTFTGRIKAGEAGEIPDYARWTELGKEWDFSTVPPMQAQDPFSAYTETRMLYSALVDADFLDTERALQGNIGRRGGSSMAELLQRLEEYIAENNFLTSLSGINGMRAEILRTMELRGKELPRGIYTLTVPTGGGKTVSSLRFALCQAVSQGLDRIIYVVPYTNIIEQTADTFRRILGEENVLEHHSQVDFEEMEEELADQKKLASENWDMPVIVTTSVQFFESLFHHKSSKSRKIHNIANSAVIYDEVQMLPVCYWTPCVRMIQELGSRCGATQVFCTATQPGISMPGASGGQSGILELTSRTEEYFKMAKRVTFRHAGLLELEQAAEKLRSNAQTLCIVNTKKTAKELFDLVRDQGNVFHLTTMMASKHRWHVLQKIKEHLKNGDECRVVATSLVEAGVDVDFGYVMRELAGLDSILQAAGRCNRNGSRALEESITEVFSLEGKVPVSMRQQVDAAKYVMQHFEQWDSLEAIDAYFQFWRSLRGPENLDVQKIMDKIKKLAFRTVSESFQIIEDRTRTVFVPWREEGEKLIGELRTIGPNRHLMRRLGQYGVAVYEEHFRRFADSGDIVMLWDDVPVLNNMNLYDEDTGLAFYGPEGEAWFV